MIVATAKGDRTGKVPGTPLRLGRIGWDNCPIIAFTGRVLHRVAGTFLELPVCDQTAASKPLFGQERSNVWQHDAEEKNTQDKCVPRYPSRARLLHVPPQNFSTPKQ